MRLQQIDGCCGVLELSELDEFEYHLRHEFEGDTRELTITLNPVMSFLYEVFEEDTELELLDTWMPGKMLIATTVPAQKTPAAMLKALGMVPRLTFKNPSGGQVTFWSMIIPVGLETKFRKDLLALESAAIKAIKPPQAKRASKNIGD